MEDSRDVSQTLGQEVAQTRTKLASISSVSHGENFEELHDLILPGLFNIKNKLVYIPLTLSQRVFAS